MRLNGGFAAGNSRGGCIVYGASLPPATGRLSVGTGGSFRNSSTRAGAAPLISATQASHVQPRNVDPAALLPALEPGLGELHALGPFEQRPFERRAFEQVT